MLGNLYIKDELMCLGLEESICFPYRGLNYPFGNFLTTLPSLPVEFLKNEFQYLINFLKNDFFLKNRIQKCLKLA